MTQTDLDAMQAAEDMLTSKARRAGRMGIKVLSSCAQYKQALEAITLLREENERLQEIINQHTK